MTHDMRSRFLATAARLLKKKPDPEKIGALRKSIEQMKPPDQQLMLGRVLASQLSFDHTLTVHEVLAARFPDFARGLRQGLVHAALHRLLAKNLTPGGAG